MKHIETQVKLIRRIMAAYLDAKKAGAEDPARVHPSGNQTALMSSLSRMGVNYESQKIQ